MQPFANTQSGGQGPAAELEMHRQIRHLEMALGKCNSVRELCGSLAEGMKQLTGCDRVFVYRLNEAGDAEIVAEAGQPQFGSLPSEFLPAVVAAACGCQRPAEARRRALDDMCAADHAESQADKKLCRDWGHRLAAGAALTVDIVQDGILWGLIACYHREPRQVSPVVWDGCEFLGERVALQLAIREKLERVRAENELRQRHMELVSNLASPNADSWLDQLAEQGENLMALVAASGAALVHREQVRLLGETPGIEDVRTLASWLRQRAVDGVFALNTLACVIRSAGDSSILAVKVSHHEGSYLIWFRRPLPTQSGIAQAANSRGVTQPWSPLDRLAAELMHSSLIGVVLEAVALRHAVTELELFRIRQAVEASCEAIVVLDSHRQVVFMNAAFARVFGPTALSLKEDDIWRALFEESTVVDQIFQALQAGTAWDGEAAMRNASGQPLPVHVRFNVIDDGRQRTGFIGLFTDLTERRRVERHLQQIQKLESLGVLAGGIAHDFNNLLTSILGFASLTRLQLPPDSAVSANLIPIETAAQRAGELCKQLLAYAGKGRFVVEAINLNQLLDEMANLLATVLPKMVRLRFDRAADLPLVMADATQMRQVVMNMITNGSDAIGEQEGTVTVRTACFEAASTCLENYSSFWGDRPEGRYACLEVSDDGCGMDAETLARIFDPFFTTKFTGRGLGLAAVQGILRGHKGAIQVTSQPGRGTTFKVLLPACESGQTNLACQDEVLRLTGGGRIILVVDDEELVRAVARSALEVAGFQVLLASDGREGVEVFRTQCDRIAAVLLDWTMPQLGGADTFQEMRRLRPDARVILCSGFSEQEVTNRLAGKGLDGFLQKPFRVSQLITTVQQVLCGSPSACRSGIENASADDGQKEEDDYAVTH